MMKCLIVLLLISVSTNLISAQNYYDCNSYYYSSYNSALCCYKTGYYTYYSYSYSYCPYYTSDTTTFPTTTYPSPASSCSYYTYSYNDNLCCVSRDTTYSYYYYYSSNYYYTYCPTTSTLDSICGSSCCYADVPVYANSDVFYYSTYHCPSTPYYNYNYYTTYCGSYCILAVVFGLFGSCFCLCGIAFSIAFCVLVHMMVNKKQKTTPVANTSYANSPGAAPESGLQDSTMAMKQQFKQETLPPQIPGYTYNPNPTNTDGVTPYPLQIDTNVNLPPNPVYNQLPQVVTHGTAQPFVPQSNIQQPPATNLPAEETYAYIQ